MNLPMNENERRAVATALADVERELARDRERGPWDDPEAEVLLTGASHPEKIAKLEHRWSLLRALR